MGFVQRALFTWFISLIFMIVLCLRLEGRIQWNWFLVLIPLWLYDLVLIIWVIIEIIKRYHLNHSLTIRRYDNYFLIIILKICSQIMMCLHIEYKIMKLYIIMIPIWLLLLILIIYIFFNLQPKLRDLITINKSSRHSTIS